jgi:hypothetical protein
MVLIKAEEESDKDTRDKESDEALATIAGGTQSFGTAKDKKGKSTKEIESEQSKEEEYSYTQKYNQYKKAHRAFTKLQNLAPALEDLAENVEVLPSDKFVSGYTTKNNASLDKIRTKYDSNSLYNFLYNLNQDKGKERSHLTENIDLTTTFDEDGGVNTRVLRPLTPPKKTVRQKDGEVRVSRPKRLPEINILLIEERYKELLEKEYDVEGKTLTFLEVLEIIHINRFRTRPSSAKSNPKNKESTKQSKRKRQIKFESMRQRLEEKKNEQGKTVGKTKNLKPEFVKDLNAKLSRFAGKLSKHSESLETKEENLLDLINKLDSKISNPNIEKTILREARTLLTSRAEGETLDDRQQKIKEYQEITTKPATISVAGKTTLPPTSPIPFDTKTPSALIHLPNKRKKLIAKLKMKVTKEILEEKAKLTELRQTLRDAKRLENKYKETASSSMEALKEFADLVNEQGLTDIEQKKARIEELKEVAEEDRDDNKIKSLEKEIKQIKAENNQVNETKEQFKELIPITRKIEKSMNTTRKEIFAEIEKLKEQGFDGLAEKFMKRIVVKTSDEMGALKVMGTMSSEDTTKVTESDYKGIIKDKEAVEMIKQIDGYIILIEPLTKQVEKIERAVKKLKDIRKE